MSNFKQLKSFEKRKNESKHIRQKYPDRIPIICERGKDNNIKDIDKNKYLVPSDLTVGQFIYIIRKRIKMKAEKSLFLFINNKIPPTSKTILSMYEENKDEDGFIPPEILCCCEYQRADNEQGIHIAQHCMECSEVDSIIEGIICQCKLLYNFRYLIKTLKLCSFAH